MYSVLLSSYRNTRESLGELEKAEHHVLVLPNFHSCFYNSIETRYMFSISKGGSIGFLSNDTVQL